MAQIKDTLASALCNAQSEFTIAAHDGKNPHYKSKFASMNELIRATRPALKKYGLAITQYPSVTDAGMHILKTEIKWQDESIVSYTPIIVDKPSNQQDFGKAMTYLCRYVYKNMLGIEASDEDDDGNSSAGISDKIDEKQYNELCDLVDSRSDSKKVVTYVKSVAEVSSLADLKPDQFNIIKNLVCKFASKE